MEWKIFKAEDHIKNGCYCVAVNPHNYKTYSVEFCNSWRKRCGFQVAIMCDGDWMQDRRVSGYPRINITNRVTHWAEMPSIPEL